MHLRSSLASHQATSQINQKVEEVDSAQQSKHHQQQYSHRKYGCFKQIWDVK